MTPQTVHLAATLIRNVRGTATAFEKWIAYQPPSSSLDDLLSVITLGRKIVDAFERSLSQVEVEK